MESKPSAFRCWDCNYSLANAPRSSTGADEPGRCPERGLVHSFAFYRSAVMRVVRSRVPYLAAAIWALVTLAPTLTAILHAALPNPGSQQSKAYPEFGQKWMHDWNNLITVRAVPVLMVLWAVAFVVSVLLLAACIARACVARPRRLRVMLWKHTVLCSSVLFAGGVIAFCAVFLAANICKEPWE